ncbi:glycoside hydrolase family 78 protein [Aplosporella prunicola CBS 121167]|uniref:Glycoside hydrolase family 78 protein n=1 Tax=Aplosporella prunicola CBS 121167 TaxID=1176127 RepID=A0A6A6BBL8_9PEZI|nr:glycoside hydrolase family 78 protein [Aplosporella prunicola CBS 121167]KAF2140998.1 glycoside hydrolase family 78 protein [Aplosporella prunicola CBS 121167]
MRLTSTLVGTTLLVSTSSAVPYSEYILAPSSRTIIPPAINQINGTVRDAASLVNGTRGQAVFNGSSAVTFDFQKNIGGLVTIEVGSSSSPDAFIGVTFTESNLWISGEASDGTADAGLDSPIWFHVGNRPGNYTAPRENDRGAFRYLSLVSNTSATVEVKSVSVNFTAAPLQDLRDYKGYFHSDDELLNKVWYAGAYTNQLCTIDPTYGDSLPWLNIIDSDTNISLPQTNDWYNNHTITNGSSTITDGAKRDRLVWPGDLEVALPSIFVSTHDLYSVKTAIEALYQLQDPSTGELPYASNPFHSKKNSHSFTYHCHSLIGLVLYYQYSGDLELLAKYWDQFKFGLQWAISSIDSSGLANITATADWLRPGTSSHNIAANAILYHTINRAIEVAAILNDTAHAANWTTTAARIKTTANTLLWDESAGLYRDNETTTLHPQDGNVWAIKANLTTPSRATRISSSLRARWGPYGAPAPEAFNTTISPFIGSIELDAHVLAGNPVATLDLIRLQWGYMLTDPRMTQSTFIEGYSTDGATTYAPYSNTPRVSHAHGWSTGPTAALMFWTAGLRVVEAAGRRWRVEPLMGDLRSVEAGFVTRLGSFACEVVRGNGTAGAVEKFSFVAPEGTSGDVKLPAGMEGVLVEEGGECVKLEGGIASGVAGGKWTLEVE